MKPAKNVRFNILQQPTVPGYLENFKARPGMKLVQLDYSAVEPRIITEFSRDPNMWKLYGPGAKANDIYLYNGAHIELFSKQIRMYYNPDDPTPETIAEAKKKLKAVRGYCKLITLAAGYGCSANKLRSMLIALGFPVSWQEARIIHRDYWELYAGIRKFQTQLENMWGGNGGWFPNISGRPIFVAEQFLHDSVNRFAQSSGADLVKKLVYYINKLRVERQVEMYPWIVDFYDETIWEVPEVNVPAVIQIFNDALQMVNDELEMEVRIEGEPQVADNLAAIKCEDYAEWKAKQKTA